MANNRYKDHPCIMGIVNVTPDSFSDSGKFFSPDTACNHARNLLAAGADIIDIGGESTRPGASRISAQEEHERVMPVISQLVQECVVSVDTMRSSLAYSSIQAGARIINDVSGSLADPQMMDVIAQSPQVRWIISHWVPIDDAAPLIDQMKEHFTTIVSSAIAKGVREEQIIIDPGIGFAKTEADNWAILGYLSTIVSWGFPVLIGVSRKRFLSCYGAEPTDRDCATAIISALAANVGVWGVRVHNIEANRAAVDIFRKVH